MLSTFAAEIAARLRFCLQARFPRSRPKLGEMTSDVDAFDIVCSSLHARRRRRWHSITSGTPSNRVAPTRPSTRDDITSSVAEIRAAVAMRPGAIEMDWANRRSLVTEECQPFRLGLGSNTNLEKVLKEQIRRTRSRNLKECKWIQRETVRAPEL